MIGGYYISSASMNFDEFSDRSSCFRRVSVHYFTGANKFEFTPTMRKIQECIPLSHLTSAGERIFIYFWNRTIIFPQRVFRLFASRKSSKDKQCSNLVSQRLSEGKKKTRERKVSFAKRVWNFFFCSHRKGTA